MLLFSMSWLGVMGLAEPARAQAQWSGRSPPVAPGPRLAAAAAFDAARGWTVLFGGISGTTVLGDTWEWDGTIWVQRSLGQGPPARQGHALAYDVPRRRAVLFGGASDTSGSATLGDTWEWDGTAWSPVSPAASPAARTGHAMAYDVSRARVVLFGGLVGGASVNETWEYDGSAWTRRSAGPSPARRAGHALAYDARRQRTVLFGGGASVASLADTWEWDGTVWVQTVPPSGPIARSGHVMAWDAARTRVVLLGGLDYAGTGRSLGDTWEWDGMLWSLRGPLQAPAARCCGAMAFDAARERIVLFGGADKSTQLGDTWEYATNRPAGFLVYGAGCPGSAGTPALDAAAFQRPWIADTFQLQVRSVPAGRAVAVAVGASNVAWGPVPLPLDLTVIGAPGCWLSASPDLIVPATSQSGAMTLSIPLPNNPWLLGQAFFAQALVVDPPANRLGVTVSNGAVAVIGAR